MTEQNVRASASSIAIPLTRLILRRHDGANNGQGRELRTGLSPEHAAVWFGGIALGCPRHPVDGIRMSSATQIRTPYPHRHLLKVVSLAVAWLVVALGAGEFLSIAYQKYTQLDAGSYGMFWTRREWLWTHIGGGVLTVLLGALQFVPRLRRSYPRLHRWTGRIFLLGMLVACVGAVGLILTSPAPGSIRTAFGSTALAWLVTAFMGYRAIRRGRVDAHRRWMIGCYLVTLAPITFRAMIRIPGMMEIATPMVMIPTLLWLSWAAPLLVYGVSVASRRGRRSGVRRDQSRVASGALEAESA